MRKDCNTVGAVDDKVAEHTRPARKEVGQKFGGHYVGIILADSLYPLRLEATFKAQARPKQIFRFAGCF